MSTEEKRKEERNVIELPLTFESGTGMTKNVSGAGLFFWTDGAPAFGIGDRVSITMEVVRSGRKIKPKIEGEIVRLETKGAKTGIGLKITDADTDLTTK